VLIKVWWALAGLSLMAVSPVLAIQAESHAEKETRLKEQALGGLFNRWTFDQQQLDEFPKGFVSLSRSGEGAAPWIIGTDDEAPWSRNVLHAASDCPEATCPRVLVAEKFLYEYPDVSIRLRFSEEDGVEA